MGGLTHELGMGYTWGFEVGDAADTLVVCSESGTWSPTTGCG